MVNVGVVFGTRCTSSLQSAGPKLCQPGFRAAGVRGLLVLLPRMRLREDLRSALDIAGVSLRVVFFGCGNSAGYACPDHAVFHDYASGVTREVQYPMPGTPPVYEGKTRWRLESQEDPATHLWNAPAVGVAKAHHHGRQRWNVMWQHRLPNSTPSSRKTARQDSAVDTVSSLYRCARWRGRVLETMSKSSIALAGRAVFR